MYGLDVPDVHEGWRAVKCPFHGDSQASASYNTTLQRFRCHACEIGGDGWDVIMQVDGIGFLEAKDKAAGTETEATQDDGYARKSVLFGRSNERRRALVRRRYSR